MSQVNHVVDDHPVESGWWYGFALVNNATIEVSPPRHYRDEAAALEWIDTSCGLFIRGPFDNEEQARSAMDAEESETREMAISC